MQKTKDHIALLVIRSYKKFKIMSTMTGENILKKVTLVAHMT